MARSREERPPAQRPPIAKLRIHNGIVDRLGLTPAGLLLDLGCGDGLTMATAASRYGGLRLVGVDVDRPALAASAVWLGELGARHALVCADLDRPLPLADGSVTHVVCHDVLECLVDPEALLAEAYRVLQPGGTAVWSHVDYESVVVGGAERDLTRRIMRAYADTPPAEGRRSDARMGRRLPALVDGSPLARADVDGAVLVATDLAGPGGHRIRDIAGTVREGGGVPAGDVDRWLGQLREADRRGEFFYAQTAYIVVSRRGTG